MSRTSSTAAFISHAASGDHYQQTLGEPWLLLHSSPVELIIATAFRTASPQVIRRLQMVLNAAARLVVGVGRYEHITPALRDVLHWLPVPRRIQFKIAIYAFDCVREHHPAYFNNVCIPVAGISGRANLRSAERHDMLVPSTRTPLGWNALP